jgi:3-oxoacyl-[acyl-carrier protein] reductase
VSHGEAAPGGAPQAPPEVFREWAVVTGGSKGIGRAIAERLLESGSNVVVVARNVADIDTAVEELSATASPGQTVIGLTADVADRASVTALFDELHTRIPHLNHFVANAGTGRVTPFFELTAEETDEVVALNFTGTILCMQLAAQMMREHPIDNSCIIVVSSIRGLGAVPGRLIYSATKAGVNQAVRVAAAELAPLGIRVNILSPGITETPLTAKNPEVFAEMTASVPMGRAGQPTDLAEAANFLCSPAARFITGLNMIVDGGESLR